MFYCYYFLFEREKRGGDLSPVDSFSKYSAWAESSHAGKQNPISASLGGGRGRGACATSVAMSRRLGLGAQPVVNPSPPWGMIQVASSPLPRSCLSNPLPKPPRRLQPQFRNRTTVRRTRPRLRVCNKRHCKKLLRQNYDRKPCKSTTS